jgi:uncharacterized membrane protein
MLRSALIGLVAGQRSLTPLAVLAGAARDGRLTGHPAANALLRNPLVATGAVALAAAEMAGDKMETAPDRTVKRGLAVRFITAAFSGAVLAPRGQAKLGALVAVATAMASAPVGLALRKRAMRDYGQTPTGFVEDAAMLAGGLAISR